MVCYERALKINSSDFDTIYNKSLALYFLDIHKEDVVYNYKMCQKLFFLNLIKRKKGGF